MLEMCSNELVCESVAVFQLFELTLNNALNTFQLKIANGFELNWKV